MTPGDVKTAVYGGPQTIASQQAQLPKLVIERRRGLLGIGFSELWRYRDLLLFLAWRDIKLRYKQTVFGAAWALLQPVLTMLIFAIFFGRFTSLRSATDGVPYPLWVFAGLLPWLFFSNSVTFASNSVISSSNLITKVYFPRLIIPFASLGVAIVDLLVGMGVMAVMLVAYRWSVSWGVLFLPFILFGLVLFSLGVGALLAALIVAYRDFRYVIPFVVQTWMFVTPVIYPSAVVPEKWRWLLWLNPVAGLVDGFRASLLGEPLASASVGVSLVGALVTFVFGVSWFRLFERRFADII